MIDQNFGVYIFFPTVLVIFVVLTSLYDPVSAYVALSWVPIVLFLILQMFSGMEYPAQYRAVDSESLFNAIVWTSFAQGLLGLAVTVHAAVRKEFWQLALIA